MPTKTLSTKLLLYILFFITAFLACGYFREYYFVQINNILYMKYYHTSSPLAVGLVMQPFQALSYDALYYSKYPATVIWSALFFGLNYLLLRIFGSSKDLLRMLVLAYMLMLVLAGLSMAYGFFINDRLQSDEYTLSRWLLGIAQGPIPGLVLLAAGRLRG